MTPLGPIVRAIPLSALLICVISGLVHASDCTVVSVGRVPLNDLQGGLYLGRYEGGLYPGGTNIVPDQHSAEGIARAQKIRPINTLGAPDVEGAVVVLSVGLSNTSQEFQRFMADSSILPEIDRQFLVLANGAASGQAAPTWDSPVDSNYNRVRDNVLIPAGLTEAQVQVVWLKVANGTPTKALPAADADAFLLERQLGDIARALAVRYQNLQMVFISSRIYGGYATTTLNPEPYAYESGFAVKWAIEAQVRQMENGTIDPVAGDLDFRTRVPWLAWGPYLWADGLSARSDGLTWSCTELASDGTHPSGSGNRKVSGMLMDFFLASPYTSPWFLDGTVAAPVVVSPNGGEILQKGSAGLLRWVPAVNGGGLVKILLHGAGGTVDISTGTEDDGEFQWAVPGGVPDAADYRIEVSSVATPSLSDFSDGEFSIELPLLPVTVVSPNGGESLLRGATESIRWSGTTADELVAIRLLNGANKLDIANNTPGDGLFEWTIPTWLPTIGGFLIEVTPLKRPAVRDMSDTTFSLRAPPSSQMTARWPNGGELWRKGQIESIAWTSLAPPDATVRIRLWLGNNVLVVADSTPNDGAFTWSVPAWLPSTSGYLIEVALAPQYQIRDSSNQVFSIK